MWDNVLHRLNAELRLAKMSMDIELAYIKTYDYIQLMEKALDAIGKRDTEY